MKLLKDIWQWLSGSHEKFEEPAYNIHTFLSGCQIEKNKIIKPRTGRRKISNIVRYR